MKKNVILIVGLLVMFIGGISCSDDKEEEKPVVTLAVDLDKLEFGVEEMELRLKVTTNAANWEYIVEGDWFEVEKYSDNKYLRVTAKTNNSVEKREGKITIKAEGGTEIVVPVMQAAAAAATLELSSTEVFFTKTGGQETLTIETNQALVRVDEVALPEGWSVEIATDNKSLIIETPENTTGEIIEVTFEVVAGVESNQARVPVTIKQVLIDPVSLNATGYRVKLDGMGKIGGTAKDSWCIVSVDGDDLLVSAGMNVGGAMRETEIEFGDGLILPVIQTGETYRTGDVFKHNGQLVGVVVSNDEDGLWVVALEAKEGLVWSTEAVSLGITNKITSAYEKVKEINDWQSKYPVFAYCEEMDEKTGMEGWSLSEGDPGEMNWDTWEQTPINPSAVLHKFYKDDIYTIVNNALKNIEGASEVTGWHWTSCVNESGGVDAVYQWNVKGTKTVSVPRSKSSQGVMTRCFWNMKLE